MNYKFDVKLATNECVSWIKNWFDTNGKDHVAVVGISGGIDSAVVAGLCVKALGKDRVIGVLMPNSKQSDIEDSIDVVDHLEISFAQSDINAAYKSVISSIDNLYTIQPDKSRRGHFITITNQTLINLPARIRMATLYAIAQSVKGHVINTCNMSETYVGYDTLWGDSTGAISPLAYFTKTEVREVAAYIGIPEHIIHKAPQDGLCGISDEESFGFSYEVLDKFLRTGICENEDIKEKIISMHKASQFKRDIIHLESFVWPLNSIEDQSL